MNRPFLFIDKYRNFLRHPQGVFVPDGKPAVCNFYLTFINNKFIFTGYIFHELETQSVY